MILKHMGIGEAIGNPVPHYRPPTWNVWDAAKLDKNPGHFLLTDKGGNSIKLGVLKEGLIVKIRANKVTYPGYEYLQSDIQGKYFCYIMLSNTINSFFPNILIFLLDFF